MSDGALGIHYDFAFLYNPHPVLIETALKFVTSSPHHSIPIDIENKM